MTALATPRVTAPSALLSQMRSTQTVNSVSLAVTFTALLILNASTPSAAADENTTQSGCQICATTGNCAHAYQNGPGQYCGNWLDRSSTRQSCCCPTNAVCKLSNYACNCAWASGNRGDNRVDDTYYRDADYYSFNWLWWLLGSLLLLLCCGSFVFMLCRKQERVESPVVYASPVLSPTPPTMYGSAPSAPGYNAQPPFSAQPAYSAQPVYDNVPVYNTQPAYSAQPMYGGSGGSMGTGRLHSGMSAGAGAALGGGAGLLGGILLGEALADAGRGDGGYDGGYDGGIGDSGFGGGGGGDFGGDF